MSLSRTLLLALVLASARADAQPREFLKSAEIDALFARATNETVLQELSCCRVSLNVLDRKAGPAEVQNNFDKVLFVRRGQATVLVGGELAGSQIRSGRSSKAGPGDLIHIPRRTPYQIDPGAGRLELIEVRVLLAPDARPPRFGAARPMNDVFRASEMDELFAKFDREQPIYVAQHFRIAYVIRQIPSAYESHGCCMDIYLPVRTGSAHVLLGGKIENPKEQNPGEVRGSGMAGSRAYEMTVGDMAMIRRAGPHYIDPRPGKVGYVIVKIQSED